MQTIRLIALDLDGTTLASNRRPSAGAREAIAEARAQGILVVLASGRIAASVRDFRDQLGADQPLVASNGAYAELGPGEMVHHLPVDDRVRDLILDYARETGIHLNVYRRDEMAMRGDSAMGDLYLSRVSNLDPVYRTDEELRNQPATKLLIVDHPDRLTHHEEILKARIQAAFPEEMDRIFSTVYSEPEYLEFLNPSADKANGLQALGERLGIPLTEMAAIGDYWNDAAMLAAVGLSASVANAPQALRERVHQVFSSNDAGGASEFLRSIVYNHKQLRSDAASGSEP